MADLGPAVGNRQLQSTVGQKEPGTAAGNRCSACGTGLLPGAGWLPTAALFLFLALGQLGKGWLSAGSITQASWLPFCQ